MTAAERERLRHLVDRRQRLLTGRSPDGIRHGTPYAYKKGCHCPDCTEAARVVRRRQRAAAATRKEAA